MVRTLFDEVRDELWDNEVMDETLTLMRLLDPFSSEEALLRERGRECETDPVRVEKRGEGGREKVALTAERDMPGECIDSTIRIYSAAPLLLVELRLASVACGTLSLPCTRGVNELISGRSWGVQSRQRDSIISSKGMSEVRRNRKETSGDDQMKRVGQRKMPKMAVTALAMPRGRRSAVTSSYNRRVTVIT